LVAFLTGIAAEIVIPNPYTYPFPVPFPVPEESRGTTFGHDRPDVYRRLKFGRIENGSGNGNVYGYFTDPREFYRRPCI
jgi:hypothetical protein